MGGGGDLSSSEDEVEEEEDEVPTSVFSIRQSLAASYPRVGEMDSDLPSKTIESDLRRMEGGRMLFPVKKDVFGVMVIKIFPESE